MIASWGEEEWATVDLKHKRRNRRLKQLVSDLSAKPFVSIPAAVGTGHAETAAAYRFFENPHVDLDAILAPHRDATLARIRQHKTVILVQDTSEIELTRPEQQVDGAGPLDGGARHGCFVHPSLALTLEGVPLGSVTAQCWTREDAPQAVLDKAARDKQRKQTPIEEKESQRWIDGLREAHTVATLVPEVEVISVADSEADIFELLVEGQAETGQPSGIRAQWVLRACQDRALLREKEADENAAKCTYEVSVRGRQSKVECETRGRRQARESRQATVEVRACRVTLRAPRRPDRKLLDVPVNAVLVREGNPPEGEEPIEWLLLTSLPIGTADEVLRGIRICCLRWTIELFFRFFKHVLG